MRTTFRIMPRAALRIVQHLHARTAVRGGWRVSASVAMLLMAGCSSVDDPQPLPWLEVAPSALVLAPGDTVRVRVTARTAAGQPALLARIDWTNSAPTVADVQRVDDTTVTVRALQPGDATLTARWRDHPISSFVVPVTVQAR